MVGGWFVAFCAFLFGYMTLIGWAYYGEQFFEYLLGVKVTVPYRWVYCLLIPFGAVAQVGRRLGVGRPHERAAEFPNLVGLIGLAGLVGQIARRR